MPSHDVHKLIDKLFLNKEYSDIHKFLDDPVRWAGPSHRKYRHDPQTLLMILLARQDIDSFLAASLHLMADEGQRQAKRAVRNAVKGLNKKR